MDGSTVWPRVSSDGKPAAYVTRNAGKTWKRLDAGLPKRAGWFTVLRQAMTGRRARSGRPLLRHDHRRAVGEPQRRRALELHRQPPAAHLRRGGGRARRHEGAHPDAAAFLHAGTRRGRGATGATLAELLADLDRRYPGIRFRMIDEQDRIRPHIRIFVNREQVHDLTSALSPTDDVQILQALSGG